MHKWMCMAWIKLHSTNGRKQETYNYVKNVSPSTKQQCTSIGWNVNHAVKIKLLVAIISCHPSSVLQLKTVKIHLNDF